MSLFFWFFFFLPFEGQPQRETENTRIWSRKGVCCCIYFPKHYDDKPSLRCVYVSISNRTGLQIRKTVYYFIQNPARDKIVLCTSESKNVMLWGLNNSSCWGMFLLPCHFRTRVLRKRTLLLLKQCNLRAFPSANVTHVSREGQHHVYDFRLTSVAQKHLR